MSLTLARVCGEWRLASGKYEEVRSGKTKYSQYEYFDNIEENRKPLKNVSRKRKAVEENQILSEENLGSEIGKPLKKLESR
jgi:hypothetical protein